MLELERNGSYNFKLKEQVQYTVFDNEKKLLHNILKDYEKGRVYESISIMTTYKRAINLAVSLDSLIGDIEKFKEDEVYYDGFERNGCVFIDEALQGCPLDTSCYLTITSEGIIFVEESHIDGKLVYGDSFILYFEDDQKQKDLEKITKDYEQNVLVYQIDDDK